MQQHHGLRSNPTEPYGGGLVDGLLQDGMDRSAAWRAHLRESTMARQAAERRYARTGLAAGPVGPESSALSRERAAAFRAELARIVADDRNWMIAHGIEDLVRPIRPRRLREATQQ